MTQIIKNLKLVDEKITPLQTLKFYKTEDNRLIFTINNYIQFVEGKDEKIYHNALTKFAFEQNSKANNYLLLGAGDGLVAREIFKFNPYAKVTLVEIAEKVIHLFKSVPKLRELNEHSLFNCNIIIEDALTWVVNNNDKKFDVIINDFPDATDEIIEELYEKQFLSDVCNLLNKNGIISIQCNERITEQVSKIIKELLGNVEVLEYEMPFLDSASIVSGIKK